MMKISKSAKQVPKAQQEVWNWKQSLYEETKNMNTAEGLI